MARAFELHWLLPAATALIAAPAGATTYFTLEQAQQQLCPGQTLAPVAITLSAAQAKAVHKASGVRVREPALKVWRAANGGWFYLDQVLGKHEMITYALALDASGAVTGLVGWTIRTSTSANVAEQPFTLPWLPLAAIVTTCAALTLVAALVGSRRAISPGRG